MKAVPVKAGELDAWLPLIRWHLGSFCRAGDWTTGDLIDGIRNGTRQLWLAFDGEVKAAVLTQIGDDRLRTCRITHAAGKGRSDWLHLFDVIENWARSEGCKNIEATARPGWERVLTDMRKTHVILEKRL